MLSILGILDVLAAIIALYSISYGGAQGLAQSLLVILLLKGVWSIMSALNA